MAESLLKTHEWERLLTYEQKEKYKNAIRQGYFSTYHGLSWRHDTFYGAFIWKHPNRVRIVKRFEDMLGHRPTWEDLTDDNLRDFFEDLMQNYSQNSVKTICAEIKAVIRENDATRNVPSVNFGSVLKAKQIPSQAVYLTMDEIRALRDYNPRTKMSKYIKRLFMLECLTGARMSDCMRLGIRNVNEDGRTLTYVSQKSKMEVTVPVHKWVKPFLVTNDPMEPKDVGFATYSRVLREMCQKCGIDTRVKIFTAGKEVSGPKYRFVSSHTGRRSFATNLSKRGIALEQISLMMGHMNGNVPNIAMTQRYIVGKMQLDAKVFDLFGAYDKDEPIGDYDEELALMKEEDNY